MIYKYDHFEDAISEFNDGIDIYVRLQDGTKVKRESFHKILQFPCIVDGANIRVLAYPSMVKCKAKRKINYCGQCCRLKGCDIVPDDIKNTILRIDDYNGLKNQFSKNYRAMDEFITTNNFEVLAHSGGSEGDYAECDWAIKKNNKIIRVTATSYGFTLWVVKDYEKDRKLWITSTTNFEAISSKIKEIINERGRMLCN